MGLSPTVFTPAKTCLNRSDLHFLILNVLGQNPPFPGSVLIFSVVVVGLVLFFKKFVV